MKYSVFLIGWWLLTLNVLFAQSKKTGHKADTLYLHDLSVFERPIDYREDTLTIKKDEISRVTFKQEVILYSSVIKGYDFIGKVTTEKEIELSFVDFQNETFIEAVRFNNSTNFINTNFGQYVSFAHSDFNDGVNFTFVTFQNGVNFRFATFKKSLELSRLHTGDSTEFSFYGTCLPDIINFSFNRNLHSEVDFTSAVLDSTRLYSDSIRRWHYINLYKSDIAKVKIDYQHFRLCLCNSDLLYKFKFPEIEELKTLSFRGDSLIFERKGYLWKDINLYKKLIETNNFRGYLKKVFPSAKLTDTVIKNFVNYCLYKHNFPKPLSIDEAISVYEQLLKNFDASGQKVSYETLDIEYRDFKNNNSIINLSYWWNCYGYHKEWIFIWTAIFLCCLTIVTSIFFKKLNRKTEENGVYYIPNIPPSSSVNSINSFLIRIWHSFIYTSTIFFLFGLKIENINYRTTNFLNIIGILYVFTTYSTGILCLGYMANFVLQK